MNRQLRLSNGAVAPMHGQWKRSEELLGDLARRRIKLVNVAFVGRPQERGWVLVDTGLGGGANTIRLAAAERFGKGVPPAAIVLTHAHFDHVGGLKALLEHWDVPVYAHALEEPYLNGSSSYPPPDTKAGGGLMTRLSPLFPRKPIDIGPRFRPLPAAGQVPFMSGWRWIHTPGHTPGHVSLWRDADGALLAGDAFVTTRQESVYAAVTEKPEMHGPPRYFTTDWVSARKSVQKLAALEPRFVLTGHGRPVRGMEMRAALHTLARDFDRIARPG